MMLKQAVRNFWNSKPCATNLISYEKGTKEFYLAHDEIVNRLVRHHLEVFRYSECAGKRVLEVGCGIGFHALQIAKYTSRFYAIDISDEAVRLARRRFELFGIRGSIFQSDAEQLPFADNCFDCVYSNGVIHHTPHTQAAADEIYRVLKDGGKAIIMIYHRNSLFYWFNLIFRNGILYGLVKLASKRLLNIFAKRKKSLMTIKDELAKVAWKGLFSFAVNVSDGIGNPLTRTYTKKTAKALFSKFRHISFDIRGGGNFLENKIKFIEKRFGWSMYVYLKK